VIIQRTERFLRTVSPAVFEKFTTALLTLPLVPAEYPLPRSSLGRARAVFWAGIKSHLARARFTLAGPAWRDRFIEETYRRLIEQEVEQEDDLIKTIVSMSAVKGIFGAAYLDEPSVWTALGFSPFPQTDIVPPAGGDLEHSTRSAGASLLHERVVSAAAVVGQRRRPNTYCVMGSGAGGAIVAHTLQEIDPDARIIVIETGSLATHDQFVPSTLDSTARLYMNGSATLSQDQQFTFRQGRTVGGSTVVNNSVCIKPTGVWWHENLVKRWEGLGVHLMWPELHATYDDIAALLQTRPVEDAVITKAARTVRAGVEALQFDAVTSISAAPVNVDRCVGCGRCNAGCQYEAKQSMLNAILPEFVRRGGELVPDTDVEELLFDQGRRRVRAVRVTDADGASHVIEADKFVLAAGAYASSKVLWRSGYLGALADTRTVGKRFSVNLGSGITGLFDEPQDALKGQQIGYVIEVPSEQMVIETAFAQPAVVGLLAPQWGRAFQETIISGLPHMATAVPVVGSSAYGQIRRGLLGESGFVIDYTMSDDDWFRLQRGMRLVAQAMFRMGARKVFAGRFDAAVLLPDDEQALYDYFAALGPAKFVHVESAHLQGGNVLAGNPNRGVVDRTMRAFGTDNLWVCDASIIPAPITLNIAMTVMALARYATPYIAGAADDDAAQAMRRAIARTR
jgi:choline dehydrogenase-like flavoprotein